MTQVAAPWSDQSFLLEVETEVGLESSGEAGGSSSGDTMNVNGGRPTCLYNDPSVFVKTEFDTGNHQPNMTQAITIYTLANVLSKGGMLIFTPTYPV